MSIKTLIVDDEAAARSRLRKMLAPFGQISIAGEARDGVEAVALIEREQPDLVFLDVQMPGLDGFEVLRTLPHAIRWPLLVFATAFDQYALRAFEANALAYLLKPIAREKLAHAIERAERLLGDTARAAEERTRIGALAEATRGPLRQIVGRLRDRYVLVPLEDVCFFRVEDGMSQVYTATRGYRTDYVLGDLEERLPDPPYFRAHRSAIVNLSKVAEVAPMFNGTFMLIMNDQQRTEIQVSERQSKRVRELLQG
jgi:two-component system, LytTR family, response regulator